MPAIMTLTQEGLDPGEPGMAREDGLADGSTIYVISTAHERTAEVALLWVGQHPIPDVNSVESLQYLGENNGEIAYSFDPTPGVYGSWRIELVTDRGTPVEDRQIRIFAIKSSVDALRIPAANEISDPEANLRRRGAAYIARSEFNAPEAIEGSAQEDGTFVSHWRPIADAIHRINTGGGAGGMREVDGDTDLELGDRYLRCTNIAPATVTVLADADADLPLGVEISIAVLDSSQVDIVPAPGVALTLHPGRTSTIGSAGFAWLRKTGPNAWDLYGVLVEAS